MDLDKLEKLIKIVGKDLREGGINDLKYYADLLAKVNNIIVVSLITFPEYTELFRSFYKDIPNTNKYAALSMLDHILEIIKLEKTSLTKIKERKIFESAEDKLSQSNISLRNNDYPSVFHNLNTALELAIKDKLEIPTTITKINTTNILEIMVKYEIGPSAYLNEVKNRVVFIDNKVKHQGYIPSKIECINAIKSVEDLFQRLKSIEIKLSDEIKNKIYEGL